MRLNKNRLRKIILEEMKKLDDVLYNNDQIDPDDSDLPFNISKRDKASSELFDGDSLAEMYDQWADDDYGHSKALSKDAAWDRKHGRSSWAKDDKDHMDRLKGDAHYDHDDEEDWLQSRLKEIKKINEKLDTEQLFYQPTMEEEKEVDEVVNVQSTEDDESGWNSMSAADTQAAEEKEAGPLNIGENTVGLSRGSLYKKRYHGRY